MAEGERSGPSEADMLAAEADVLSPLIESWRELHSMGQMSDCDLVGAFILACAAARAGSGGGQSGSKGGWCLAPMKPPILSVEQEEAVHSSYLRDLPGLIELLGINHLERWLGGPDLKVFGQILRNRPA